MDEMRYVAYPGEGDFDMGFSTTDGEDMELCQEALDELSNNKGEDE